MTRPTMPAIQSGQQFLTPYNNNNGALDDDFADGASPSRQQQYATSRTMSYPPGSTVVVPPSKPLGFGIVAEARRMEYKNKSQRRLLQLGKSSSVRHLVSPRMVQSERKAETSPLLSDSKRSETTDGDYEKDELLQEETVLEALWDMVFGQWVSLLLVFAPFAVAAHFLEWDPKYIFWLCFLTMIPLGKQVNQLLLYALSIGSRQIDLTMCCSYIPSSHRFSASILGDFTEEAALHTNEVIGGLVSLLLLLLLLLFSTYLVLVWRTALHGRLLRHDWLAIPCHVQVLSYLVLCLFCMSHVS